MACNCKGRTNTKYKWTGSAVNADGQTVALTVTYDTEIQAKAKVLRKGGSYVAVPSGG